MRASALSAVAPGRFKLPVEAGKSNSFPKKSEVSSEDAMSIPGYQASRDHPSRRLSALSRGARGRALVNSLTQIPISRRPWNLSDRTPSDGPPRAGRIDTRGCARAMSADKQRSSLSFQCTSCLIIFRQTLLRCSHLDDKMVWGLRNPERFHSLER